MILCVCLSPAVDVTYAVTRLAVGGTNRVREVARRPGGKSVNVARILRALGERVQVLAPVGGGTGAEFAADLARLGVDSELVPNRPATRRTVAVVDETTGEATVFAEPAEIDCWSELVERFDAATAFAEVVVISGVVPDGAPPDALSTLVGIARRADRPVVVDTSGSALLDALSAHPTIVKPNAEELAEVTSDDDPLRAACTLARTYRTTVVASLGADGLIAVAGERAWRARPAGPLIGNPTGAGDALVAGLARGLRRDLGLPDLLPDCVALSAAAVLSRRAGEFEPSDHADQLNGVLVHALDGVG